MITPSPHDSYYVDRIHFQITTSSAIIRGYLRDELLFEIYMPLMAANLLKGYMSETLEEFEKCSDQKIEDVHLKFYNGIEKMNNDFKKKNKKD